MDELSLREVLEDMEVFEVSQNKDWLNSPCPLSQWTHPNGTDNNPSFGVKINDEGESYYQCYGCANSGSLASLTTALGHFKGIPSRPLVTKINMLEANRGFRTWEERKELEQIRKKEREPVPLDDEKFRFPSVNEFPEAMEYLNGRSINQHAINELDLQWHISESRIIFPVRDRAGTLFGFSGRSVLPPEQFPVYDKGTYAKIRDFSGLMKTRFILGSQNWEKGKPVLILEGLFALAHMYSIGADSLFNLGASMSAHMSDYQASTLIEFGEPVYILYDNDQAGSIGLFGPIRNGAHVGGGACDKIFKHLPLYIPEYPEGIDDPDDLTYEQVEFMRNNTPLDLG